MSGCNCTGNCRTEPYTCGGTVFLETQEEIESYAKSRYKTLHIKEKKEKCPNCGCHLKEQDSKSIEFLTE